MNGLKKAVAAFGLVGLLSSPYLLNKAYAQEPTQTVSQEPSLEQLANEWKIPVSEVEKIAQEMKQPVAETLKGYATPVCHDSYNREVFQENLPKEQRKPVLVLFYLDEKHAETGASQGLASVYKTLVKEFGSRVKFLSYNQDCDSWSSNYSNIRSAYDIRAPPSIVMYAPFDLLNGETPANNAEIIKRIDTLRGGIDKTKSWEGWVTGVSKWIKTNLTSPNYNILRRFNNTGEPKDINM